MYIYITIYIYINFVFFVYCNIVATHTHTAAHWSHCFHIHIIFDSFDSFEILLKSSYRRCSIKKAVLKNFAIFIGKHLCRSLFLINFQTYKPATILKKDSNTGFFL